MKPLHLVLGVTSAGLFLASSSRDDNLAFRPALDRALTKEFSTLAELVLTEAEVLMNGAETDPASMGLGELEISMGVDLRCVDNIEELADGRPARLVRDYEKLAAWFVEPGGEESRKSAENLEGRSVRFDWNAESETYARSYVGSDPDTGEALEIWAEDLDLRSLLPGREVGPGATWEISGAELFGLLVPGPDVRFGLNRDGVFDDDFPQPILAALRELMETTTAQCRYAGRAEGQSALGIIEVRASLNKTVQLEPHDLQMNAGGNQPDTSDIQLELALELEGRCTWNIEEGRFASFSILGAGEVLLDLAVTFEEMGMSIDAAVALELNLEHEAQATE